MRISLVIRKSQRFGRPAAKKINAVVTFADRWKCVAAHRKLDRVALAIRTHRQPHPPHTASISLPADARFAPGTNIAFDWSDVAGAVSYTIQIDDRDTFASPLIVNQTSATSQFSTNTLPTLTMWWRVRANNAAGNAGSCLPRADLK